jgi:hypothetical protein
MRLLIDILNKQVFPWLCGSSCKGRVAGKISSSRTRQPDPRTQQPDPELPDHLANGFANAAIGGLYV